MAWRAHNKKIKVDDIQKKRSRKTTRIQKAVVGMSIEEIRRKKAESREDRDKNADAAAKEIKDRKAKQMQQKKAAAAKNQKGGGKAQDKAINKNIKPAKGGKKWWGNLHQFVRTNGTCNELVNEERWLLDVHTSRLQRTSVDI